MLRPTLRNRWRLRSLLTLVSLIVLLVACSEQQPQGQPSNEVAASQAALSPFQPSADQACEIDSDAVMHNTFDPAYRSPLGATVPGTTLQIRLRAKAGDLTAAVLWLHDARSNRQLAYPMHRDVDQDAGAVAYDWWFARLPTGNEPTILYYSFELTKASAACATPRQAFYVDDDVQLYGGGYGTLVSQASTTRFFQISVYDPAFEVAEWLQRGTIYQIMVDRFRNGDPGNDPSAGRFYLNQPQGALLRSGSPDWNAVLCDPRGTYQPACPEAYANNFYGGDLAGISQKLEDGYFRDLGVTILYLTPVFRSPTYHKYDTADFFQLDPDFGTPAEFQHLLETASAQGISVILDGSFAHTSADSPYFDYYHRYDAAGNLVSPSATRDNDGSGACESARSPYYGWFLFGPPIPGQPTCANASVRARKQGYASFFDLGWLPRLDPRSEGVRAFFWGNGRESVGPYWTRKGISGWRLDAPFLMDGGLARDPQNDFWEGFRLAIRDSRISKRSDTVLIGETWQDASPWLLGKEWDSAMNYRLRNAMLSWLFTGCVGPACHYGLIFEDNDNNLRSSISTLSPISPSQFNAQLLAIWEDYPPPAFKAMMNVAASHDTARLRFMLKKVNYDDDTLAVQRMKELYIFLFTYPGAPTIYYGDEVGLTHDSVHTLNGYQDDPYNRIPYPWPDASGNGYQINQNDLLEHVRKMSQLRRTYRVLQDGDVQHGLIVDDSSKIYGFARTNDAQTALIALNRDTQAHAATFSGLDAPPYDLPDGTLLTDTLNGGQYTVVNGQVTLNVPSNWGVVLVALKIADSR